MPVNFVPIQSAPAVATNPRIASKSGIPAAASEPKAMTSTAIVSGQDITSERIIAALFSSLNSDHSAAEPVRETSVPGPAARPKLIAQAIRGSHHLGSVCGRTAAHYGHPSARRDRLAGAGRAHRSDCRVAPQQADHAAHGGAEDGARAVASLRAHDHDERVAAQPIELPVDHAAGLHGL